jgi:hypothetical protein
VALLHRAGGRWVRLHLLRIQRPSRMTRPDGVHPHRIRVLPSSMVGAALNDKPIDWHPLRGARGPVHPPRRKSAPVPFPPNSGGSRASSVWCSAGKYPVRKSFFGGRPALKPAPLLYLISNRRFGRAQSPRGADGARVLAEAQQFDRLRPGGVCVEESLSVRVRRARFQREPSLRRRTGARLIRCRRFPACWLWREEARGDLEIQRKDPR